MEAVAPLLARSVTMEHDGRRVELLVIGADERGAGGPPALQQGRQLSGSGEIVIDRVFAAEEGVTMGDRLVVDDRSWRVVGVASGGHAFVAQLAWIPFEVISECLLPVIWVLVLIGFAVGSTVIALTIYTSTIEKRAEFGVLKAIGFSNRRLYGIVCRQALAAGLAGLVVGTAATFVLAALVERAMPSFVVHLSAVEIVFVGAVALAMSAAASLVPIRPVARLDPAEVFRV